KKQNVVQVIEDVRLGAEGLLAHLSLSDGITHPLASLSPLELYSTSYVGDFNFAYPIVRSRFENLDVTTGFQYIIEKVDAATSTLSRDNLRIFYLQASGNE